MQLFIILIYGFYCFFLGYYVGKSVATTNESIKYLNKLDKLKNSYNIKRMEIKEKI
jgi:hypothetical protein